VSIPSNPRRGDVYWIDWNPARGSEQGGPRPSLIVSNDGANRTSPNVIAAAITSNLNRPYRFHVGVPALTAGTGLDRDSVVRCEQLLTTSKLRLGARIGRLTATLMDQVDEALRVSLDL